MTKTFWSESWWKPIAVVATFSAILGWAKVINHMDGHPKIVQDRVQTLSNNQIGLIHEAANLRYRIEVLEDFKTTLRPADEIYIPLQKQIDELKAELRMQTNENKR